MSQQINEILNCEDQATEYYKKYKDQCEAYSKGLVAKAVGVKAHNIVQLGRQLDFSSQTQKFMEANGNLNNVGELQKVTLDVITAVMANSILSVAAHTQQISAQKSLIHFMKLIAGTAGSNLSVGDTILDPKTGLKTPKGFSTSGVLAASIGNTAAMTLSYSATLSGGKIRSQFTKVTFSASVYAFDKGPEVGGPSNVGILVGRGMSGTINYDTGVIAVDFASQPSVGQPILVDYQLNLEELSDIAKIQFELTSELVEAQPYALKTTIGLFQQFALKQQIGDSALDKQAIDLTKAINAEIGAELIAKYAAVVPAQAITFSKSLPMGAAYTEKMYRENYGLRIADVNKRYMTDAQRGSVNVMIVGAGHAAFVEGLDGFNVLSRNDEVGPHVFGTYKGITYIRVPEAAVLADDAGIALHLGSDNLTGAGMYCPFMPLTFVNKPNGVNPLNDQVAAATMCGLKVTVPQFVQRLNLTA